MVPSFEETPRSPALDVPGVAVALAATSFARGTPAVLHGTYVADSAMLDASCDQPLTSILIVAICRDRPDLAARTVTELPFGFMPRDRGEPSPTFRETGHFNLDLRAHLELPDEPGRYWLVVSMGDHLTAPIAFEIE